jgi:hypothetical protein
MVCSSVSKSPCRAGHAVSSRLEESPGLRPLPLRMAVPSRCSSWRARVQAT